MPIDTESFYKELCSANLQYFVGVPDSLLKSFCAYAKDNASNNNFLIAANEGNAIGIASGYYISTGTPAVVYMQNSGLGNAINPLLSLADEDVYSIPMLLLIGWRGEPGVKDEPQHVKQGKVTLTTLEAFGIAYDVLDEETYEQQIATASTYMKENEKPYALVVKKGAFSSYETNVEAGAYPLTREEALRCIVEEIPPDDFIVSTTGKTSRELFEIRESLGQSHSRDFLTVGSMGHASSIAYGMAYGAPSKKIWCIDGDGALIMHLGAAPIVATSGLANYRYIVNVNGAHESVGGQPTICFDIDVAGILKASGFDAVVTVKDASEIVDAMKMLALSKQPSALVLYTAQGSRDNLGRPTSSPQENKKSLMEEFAHAE